jgi:Ca2+-binding EF-hand superfamily protein
MKNRHHRLSLITAALLLAGATVTATAAAHGDKGERFKRADKNGDGFITQDEVSERRWERIRVADANGDGKISLEELRQAFADGKIQKHKRGKHKGDRGKHKA